MIDFFKNHFKKQEQQAKQGDAHAQCILGICYQEGSGVEQSYTEAFKWLKKSAEQGHDLAQLNLGICYQEGSGAEQSYTEAFKWLKKSAEQGHKYAQFTLGNWYYHGRGVEQSYAEAFKWFKKSAAQGQEDAECSLGVCYRYGHGVEQSHTEAIKWYKKSVEQDNALAQYNLGTCYYNGYAVKQSYPEALKWYIKSAEQGNEYAKIAAKDLKNRLDELYISKILCIDAPDNAPIKNKLIDNEFWATQPSFKIVKQIIDNGADVNSIDDDGQTPLMYAVDNWSDDAAEIVKILLENGADVNARDKFGDTALIMPAAHGRSKIIQTLINAGVDVNVKNKYGYTALMVASLKGHIDNVILLLENGAYKSVRTQKGETALSFAKEYGYSDVVKKLSENEKLKLSNEVIQSEPLKNQDEELDTPLVHETEPVFVTKPSDHIIDEISFHNYYIPMSRGGKNDKYSCDIIKFKDNHPISCEYFFDILKNKNFNNIDAVVYMPSSDATRETTPVKELAQRLAEYNGWIDATDCLVRHTSKQKAAHGGDRSIAVHEKTLVVRNKDKIYNKNVLVLDDITTTGNSLKVAMMLLNDAGAESVASFALGRTSNKKYN